MINKNNYQIIFGVFLTCAIAVGLASCRHNPPIDNSNPPIDNSTGSDTCPAGAVRLLEQPTGAVAYVLDSPPDGMTTSWGLLSRSQGEDFFDVDYAPQLGWPIPSETYGMGFDVSLVRTSSLAEPPIALVGYMLEYTFPVNSCDVDITWGTAIEYSLPNGICLHDRLEITACEDGNPISVNYLGLGTITPWIDAISIEDNLGIGNRTDFEASRVALGPNESICGRLGDIDVGTSASISDRCIAEGAFVVAAGVAAHVYVGVQIWMQAGSALELGRQNNDTDQLSNEGKFEVVTPQGNPAGFITYTVSSR